MAARVLTAALFCFPSMLAVRASHAPVLVEEPADTVAIPVGLSRSATLSCRAISYGSVSVIEWYKDDLAIDMASLPRYNATNTSLVVGTTDARDEGHILEGTYYCVISNTFGAVRSRNALVKTQRLVSTIRPPNGIYYSKETVVFAQLMHIQKPLVQWSISCHRRTLICPGVSCPLWHHASVAGRVLLFSLLRLTYNGIKSSISECEINDTISIYEYPGQPDTVVFSSQSFLPTSTLIGSQNISVTVDGIATLYCISNHPNSTYTWKRDGSPIHVDNHSRYSFIIDGVLQIQNVTETDGGLYICSATAVYPDYGQQTRNTMANLTVYSLPNVNLTLVQDGMTSTDCNSTTVCRVHSNVSSVTIVCQFNGSVPLLVQILHNAVILFQQTVTDNQRSVQHNATNRLSSGVYQCIANNPYGSIQTSLYVLVQGSTTDVSTATSLTSTVQQIFRSSPPITSILTSNTSSHPTTQQSRAPETPITSVARATSSSSTKQRKTTEASPVQINSDSDSTVALEVLAVLGWTLLLCVNIIIIIVWIRHRVITRRRMSRFVGRQKEMRENSACSVMPLRYTAGTLRNDAAVEYEEVRTVSRDSENHGQYETPVATNTSL